MFNFLIVLLCQRVYGLTFHQTEMVNAAAEIILNKHPFELSAINFLNVTSGGHYIKTNDFINEFYAKIISKVTVKTFETSDLALKVKTKSSFRVFHVNTFQEFEQSMKIVALTFVSHIGQYLIMFENATWDDMRQIFRTLWDSYIHHVNVLSKNSSEFVSVHTFIPYSTAGCSNTEPVELTRFSNGSFNPQPEYFYPNKFKNFHRCALRVATYETLAPSVLRENNVNGSYRLYGRDVDTYTTLSKILNFELQVSYITPFGGWGILYPNGSGTGAIGRVITREADFTIGNILLKFDRTQAMGFSYPYFIEQLVLMIPPGKSLTSFRKLFRPFQFQVWITLGFTLLCACLVISLLLFQSKSVQEFCFGQRVRSPFMNILVAMFGGCQHVLPKNNFA